MKCTVVSSGLAYETSPDRVFIGVDHEARANVWTDEQSKDPEGTHVKLFALDEIELDGPDPEALLKALANLVKLLDNNHVMLQCIDGFKHEALEVIRIAKGLLEPKRHDFVEVHRNPADSSSRTYRCARCNSEVTAVAPHTPDEIGQDIPCYGRTPRKLSSVPPTSCVNTKKPPPVPPGPANRLIREGSTISDLGTRRYRSMRVEQDVSKAQAEDDQKITEHLEKTATYYDCVEIMMRKCWPEWFQTGLV